MSFGNLHGAHVRPRVRVESPVCRAPALVRHGRGHLAGDTAHRWHEREHRVDEVAFKSGQQ
jgi:hypothetical protein